MGAEVVLAPLGVVHMWLQYLSNLSKMCIDYVKDAAVDTWSTSSD